MNTDALLESVWEHWPKAMPRGRRADTGTPMLIAHNGYFTVPAAMTAALDFPDRVHLFIDRTAPGRLWLCPAEPDDTSAYVLHRPTTSRDGRCGTSTGLFDALQIDPDLDVARGEWTVEGERIVVCFPVDSEDAR